MRIYCDMNIYNRCFDDQSQLRIRLETGAIEGVFELAEGGVLELVWSFMLDYENSLNPREERREWAELSSGLCIHRIAPAARILALAKALIRSSPEMLYIWFVQKLGNVIISCDDDLVRIV